MTYACPVCGWPELTQEYGVGRAGVTAEQCPCCAFDFGADVLDDWTLLRWRFEWIGEEMPFRSPCGQPAPQDFDPERQLAEEAERQHPKPVGPFTCPVCGFPGLQEDPRPPSGGGSYEICPSCGFQFGFTDEAEGISDERWRAQWLAAGTPWSSSAIAPPRGWDPERQLAAVTGES